MDWFRSWHGAPADPKWKAVARLSGVSQPEVIALVWALLDRASASAERGSIAGYDLDFLADTIGSSVENVAAVLKALTEKGVLVGERFAAWDKRQSTGTDNSTARVRAFRKRKAETDETKRNAETPQEREEEKDSDSESLGPPDRAPIPSDAAAVDAPSPACGGGSGWGQATGSESVPTPLPVPSHKGEGRGTPRLPQGWGMGEATTSNSVARPHPSSPDPGRACPTWADEDRSRAGPRSGGGGDRPPSSGLTELSALAGYGDAELKTLQLRFDLLDVRELLPSLVAWCDRKRIVAAHERKTAIFAALAREQKKREAARKLLAEATGPPIAVSADLTKALGRRRRPGAR